MLTGVVVDMKGTAEGAAIPLAPGRILGLIVTAGPPSSQGHAAEVCAKAPGLSAFSRDGPA
jgi:hypothetical protein